MFYSASTSLMIVQAQEAERDSARSKSPVNRVEATRRPKSRDIASNSSAIASARARRWPLRRAGDTGKAEGRFWHHPVRLGLRLGELSQL